MYYIYIYILYIYYIYIFPFFLDLTIFQIYTCTTFDAVDHPLQNQKGQKIMQELDISCQSLVTINEAKGCVLHRASQRSAAWLRHHGRAGIVLWHVGLEAISISLRKSVSLFPFRISSCLVTCLNMFTCFSIENTRKRNLLHSMIQWHFQRFLSIQNNWNIFAGYLHQKRRCS